MPPVAPEGYRYRTLLTIRFADLDVMGHLNHAKYLTFMEQARVLYIRDVCGPWGGDWQKFGVILAKVTVDYLLPANLGDTVSVYTRCARLGGKSFDLEYILIRHTSGQPDVVIARAMSVMVAYDYARDESVPVPEAWREQMVAYEPGLGA